jgi:hypothetical protein
MFKKLGDVLDYEKKTYAKYSPSLKATDSLDFLGFVFNWEKIVGPRLSAHTIPLKFLRDSLTIMTDHPVYSQQLSLMEEQLIAKIKKSYPQFGNKIGRLFFQVNDRFFEQQRNEILNKAKNRRPQKEQEKKEKEVVKSHPFDPQFKTLKAEAEKHFADFEDDEVREALISVYIQSRQNS